MIRRTPSLPLVLTLLAVLIPATVATLATCDGSPISPFPSKLFGKTYTRLDDCYRPRAESSLTIFSKAIRFFPFNGDPFVSCPPYYRLVYRQFPRHPYLVSYPPIEYDQYVESKSCRAQQAPKRTFSYPRGNTRDKFSQILKDFAVELPKISNFQCGTTKDGFVIIKSGRNYEQVDVEMVIGYVRTVAYQYNICLE